MQGFGGQGQEYDFAMILQKAGIIDCEELYRMQLKCFRELLEKYRDYDFSPGAEKNGKDGKKAERTIFRLLFYLSWKSPYRCGQDSSFRDVMYTETDLHFAGISGKRPCTAGNPYGGRIVSVCIALGAGHNPSGRKALSFV